MSWELAPSSVPTQILGHSLYLTWTPVCIATGTTPVQEEAPKLQPKGREGKQAAGETAAREAESNSKRVWDAAQHRPGGCRLLARNYIRRY